MSRLPVRLRVTLVFAAVMAVVLGATGLFVYARLRADLDDAIHRDLESRAAILATTIRVNDVGLGESARSLLRNPRDGFAQVLRANGRLFDARVQKMPPVLDAADVHRAKNGAITVDLTLRGEHAPSRVLATPIGFEGNRLITVVGTSLADRNHALDSLRELLLIGGPVALLLAALAAYATVAAALRPVEAMRARAAEVSDAQAGQRLPVPPARDELQRLGETLNAMLDRIDAARQRERAFVDDASHELRAPLATHRAELELALRYDHDPEELRAAIASAIEDADRLTGLAEDLLELARADKGALDVQRSEVQVAELLGAAGGRVPDGTHVDLDPGQTGTVSADRARLEQALGNLVDNAVRYGRPPVRLWARAANGHTELHVSDSGSGFPPEFLPHAFERFRRADAARSDGGTGLGLAIVDAIAVAHGGRACAANDPGGGADVWIEIPLT
jgi:two-component system, OmpR family, sensor kinase